jgi:glycosyltransferase involved in cell wall biosynthesis
VKVLHVLTTLDVGGAEMHVLAQARGQVRRGHEVRIAWLKGQGTLAPDFTAAGAKCVGRLGTGPRLATALWPHMRWADIVHTHLLKADMTTAIVATLAGRRRALVASKHNDEQVLRRPAVSLVHGLLGALPQRTIVLSDHVGTFIERHGRVPRSKQTRIYYGLDPGPFEAAGAMPRERREALRRELGVGGGDVMFLCVARFAPQKAHGVLLRAFARARELRTASDPGLSLVLVGDDPFGPGRVRAQALARELQLGGSVVFTGIRRDVPELLGTSDVFVMSSLWEGLGLVFLEAMAARRPVLATRVSAVPEVVVDGQTGLLVPPAEPEPLARAMLELARDGALRQRLGEAGHARVVDRFGLERMVEETLEVYAQVRGA